MDSPQNEIAHHPAPVGKKFRRTLSCLSCQKRKVKCDRVKPCRACCIRGAPSECEFGVTKKDRHFMDQSDLIEQLQARVKELENRLLKQTGEVSTATDESPSSNENSPRINFASSAETKELTKNVGKTTPANVTYRPTVQSLLASSPSPEKILMEIFVGELINGFSPDPSDIHGRVFDLRSASEKRIFSPLLASGFGAASLTFIGQRDQHPKMIAAGHSQYSRTLKLLQSAVNHQEKCKSTEVLTAVVLLTIIEAFKQTSPGAVMKHQLGGLELLRIRTPYRHRSGLEQSLYIDLRMFWVTTAIASRRATFLANEDWKVVPWPENGPPKDMLHLLLDVAVDIPAFLGKYDELKTALRRGKLPKEELACTHHDVQATARELDQRLQLWHSLYALSYEHGFMTQAPANSISGDDKFPVLKCHDLSTGGIIEPTILIYPDLMLAVTVCLHRALRLVVAGNDDDGLVTVLRPHERYQLAVDICRSMRYYLHTVPGFLVSRIMFVLRVAFDTFSEGMIEKKFAQELFWYIGNKYRFPVFMNECAESATAVRAVDNSASG
ncbi:putative C6 finger domain protein [Talaromyces proteolyticus]|uniref:C6 finger domain protein n=1 Tax=Talaromyces proteolyticus TaxID=1131652 RepID=A0AAD4PTE5_9EURO|nr:putative C6 finger domain protein [Talaromyces proteolyticus]KAH8690681.1 putative C6 finger domain protein [Talaromyces proteolyticus]